MAQAWSRISVVWRRRKSSTHWTVTRVMTPTAPMPPTAAANSSSPGPTSWMTAPPVDQPQPDDLVAEVGREPAGAVDVGGQDAGDALGVVGGQRPDGQALPAQLGGQVPQPGAGPDGGLLAIVVDVDDPAELVE